MKFVNEDREARLAVYMLENNATVRQTAYAFGISKSTVHKDLTIKLKHSNKILYNQVIKVLQQNKKERHLRGGMATRLKYLSKKERT
ncbi:sporulation transcriptional regulator SpoIIID [Eubacteriales bacterium OttesenSCG-928-G02]|nr:sporulation transcriptional regulator SpoIIID [Eubacteriales bacterium OttesenSCG-928-G02]